MYLSLNVGAFSESTVLGWLMSRLCHLFFLSLFVSPSKIKTSFNFHIDRGRREHFLKMIYEICD